MCGSFRDNSLPLHWPFRTNSSLTYGFFAAQNPACMQRSSQNASSYDGRMRMADYLGTAHWNIIVCTQNEAEASQGYGGHLQPNASYRR